MYENGTVVPVETIFAKLRKIKHISYVFGEETAKLVTKETSENLTKIIDISELKGFLLSWIPSNFDFETFKKFTDTHKQIYFHVKALTFSNLFDEINNYVYDF
uniref:Uncharacterized protein n=1 Tax=Panagrolaimus superbus TaxID=310955 RepID=A0A914XS64_9BILA